MERGEDSFYDYQPAAFIHNRPLLYFFKFMENYGKHLSSDFLFFKGDSVQIYQTIGSGLMLLATAPFFLAGFVQLFRKNNGSLLILVGFLLSLTASSLTRFVPSASRILMVAPFLAIIVAIGLIWFIEQVKVLNYKRVFIVSVSLSLAFNFSIYFRLAYVKIIDVIFNIPHGISPFSNLIFHHRPQGSQPCLHISLSLAQIVA